jgi:hypothetical protein
VTDLSELLGLVSPAAVEAEFRHQAMKAALWRSLMSDRTGVVAMLAEIDTLLRNRPTAHALLAAHCVLGNLRRGSRLPEYQLVDEAMAEIAAEIGDVAAGWRGQ